MLGHSLGHYRLAAKIGAGAMGVVYRARDTRLNRDVAVKVLSSDLLADADARRRFRKEALALSSTNHPNIATIYDFDSEDGTDFLVMELVGGAPLAETIARGALSSDRTAALGLQLAEALDAAHRQRIVHRDIKPGNLRLTEDGRLKVLDFGVARRVTAGDDTTRTGSSAELHMPGTLPYMAPEQVRGDAADERSDIYSAGVVLFELATGRRPFTHRNTPALIHAIVSEPVEAPRSIVPSVSAALEAVILKAIEKQPDRRYQSAREMAIDLRRVVDPTFTATTRPPVRVRLGRVGWLMTAAVVLVTLIAAPSFVSWRRRNAAAPSAPASSPTTAVNTPSIRFGMLPVRDLAHTGAAPWSDIIATLFSGELTGATAQFAFVDPLSLMMLLRDSGQSQENPAAVRRLLIDHGIEVAFEPVVMKATDGFELRSTIMNPRTGETSFSTSAPVTAEEKLPEAVHLVASRMITYLDLRQGVLADVDVRPWLSLRTQNIEAVKEFAVANQYVFNYQPGEVEKHLRRAIELDRNFIAARLWLISGLIVSGDIAAAKDQYAFVKALEPQASPFEAEMIAHAGARIDGDLAAAARHLELALQYSPGNNILIFNLAATRGRLGDYDRALHLMQPLVDAGWGYPPLYAFWGVCALRAGRWDDARRGLEKGLRVPAVDPNVHGMLEALAIERGDQPEATRQRRLLDARTKDLKVKPSPALVGVYDLVGDHAKKEGHPDAAQAVAARAQQLRVASEVRLRGDRK